MIQGILVIDAHSRTGFCGSHRLSDFASWVSVDMYDLHGRMLKAELKLGVPFLMEKSYPVDKINFEVTEDTQIKYNGKLYAIVGNLANLLALAKEQINE